MGNERVWRYTLLGTLLSLLAVVILVQIFRIQLNPEEVGYFTEMGDGYARTQRTSPLPGACSMTVMGMCWPEIPRFMKWG